MQVKPLKVRERGDAARYILRVVVTDKVGCERDDMGATNARGLLAVLNGVKMGGGGPFFFFCFFFCFYKVHKS